MPLCGCFGENNYYCTSERRNFVDKFALTLLIIGGLNWGLVGIFSFDLVAWICGGQGSIFARIIYTVIALAAAWCISLLFRKDAMAEEI